MAEVDERSDAERAADAFISLLTQDQVLRLLAGGPVSSDGTVLDEHEVVKALVRRADRKAARRAAHREEEVSGV